MLPSHKIATASLQPSDDPGQDRLAGLLRGGTPACLDEVLEIVRGSNAGAGHLPTHLFSLALIRSIQAKRTQVTSTLGDTIGIIASDRLRAV